MRRRVFLVEIVESALVLVTTVVCAQSGALTKTRRFEFRIKTKSGGIVSGVVVTGTDLDNAKAKLMKRYKDCTVLSSKEL